eukprot:s1616_g11.t1
MIRRLSVSFCDNQIYNWATTGVTWNHGTTNRSGVASTAKSFAAVAAMESRSMQLTDTLRSFTASASASGGRLDARAPRATAVAKAPKVAVGPETYWTTQRSFYQSSVQGSKCARWSAAPRKFHRIYARTPGPGNYELNRDLQSGGSVGSFSKAERFQVPRELQPKSLSKSASGILQPSRNPRSVASVTSSTSVLPKSLRPWQQTPKESPGPTSFWFTCSSHPRPSLEHPKGRSNAFHSGERWLPIWRRRARLQHEEQPAIGAASCWRRSV